MTTNGNRMTDQEIKDRLEFLGFTQSEARLLESLKAWATEATPKFAKQFYDRSFKNQEFAAIIKANNSTQERLEGAQAAYALDLFRGTPDSSYVDKRYRIGAIHARINITPRWYISSYQLYHDYLYPMIRDHLRNQPNGEEQAEQAATAINKLLLFDQGLIMDTYIAGIVDQLKGLITQVANTSTSLAGASGQLSTVAGQAGEAIQGISATSQQVAEGAEKQTQRSQEITTGMGQLSQAIEQVAKGSQEQATSIEAAATTVSQVSKAISEVAGSAQGAADGSRQANEAAKAGKTMVDKTVDGMGRIKLAVESVSSKVSGLGQQSAEIGKIVKVIDDIAAQTNLLALNAAIEAARAGEQGRGFAVVADEVRKLAERVTTATKEIANLIDAVQKGVSQSIKATEDGTKEVNEGSALAEEAGKALDQIMGAVEAVAAQIEQISAAAEQVSASSDEMVKTIDSVKQVVEQNSAATEQMSASSTQVSDAVEGIAKIIEENSAAIQQMSASAQEVSAQVQEVVTATVSLDGMAQSLQEAVASFTKDGKNAQKQATPVGAGR